MHLHTLTLHRDGSLTCDGCPNIFRHASAIERRWVVAHCAWDHESGIMYFRNNEVVVPEAWEIPVPRGFVRSLFRRFPQ